MRVAIFSDTHGNAVALDAMIRHAEACGVGEYLNLGDMVGYYPRGRDVVERARALPGAAIQGNHERFLERVLGGELDLAELTSRYGDGHRIALEELSGDAIAWLRDLPVERAVEVDGLRILMCHGAPGDPDRYVYPDTPVDQLRALCDDAYDYVVMGHTHYPYTFTHGSSTLVNVGSVGQSKDVGGLATWVLLDTTNRTHVLQRTPYDLEALVREVTGMRSTNEHYLLSVLSRNRYDGR